MRCEQILVGLDSSPRAPFVLATAAELAKRFGARMILFRAVGYPRDLPPQAFTYNPDDLAKFLTQQAEAELVALSREVPTGIQSRCLVRLATPWEGVCSAAREEGADLIVIGSHGFSGIDRLLGTTAARVVNHADRSVFVARQTDGGGART